MSFMLWLLLTLTGLSLMGFGLFLFYAWLPLLYALFGFDIGLLIGRTLSGDTGTIAIVLGIACAVVLAVSSYFLEPYRRILVGVSGGILFGLSVSAALGLDGWLGGVFGRILALFCGVIGGVFVLRFFDLFVIGASSIAGAAIVMMGANHVFPDVGLFDPATGGVLPVLLVIVLSVAGISWQYSNIAKWNRLMAMSRDDTESSAKSRNGAH
jgi:hypothetical protein